MARGWRTFDIRYWQLTSSKGKNEIASLPWTNISVKFHTSMLGSFLEKKFNASFAIPVVEK